MLLAFSTIRILYSLTILMAQLPVRYFSQLFAKCSTIFAISGEVDQQETLKTTYKSYDLDLVWNIQADI